MRIEDFRIALEKSKELVLEGYPYADIQKELVSSGINASIVQVEGFVKDVTSRLNPLRQL